METPKVGDIIYIYSSDDVWGGKAFVSKIKQGISGGELAVFVSVEQNPGCEYNWEFLGARQQELKERFKDAWAYPDSLYGYDNRSSLAFYTVEELKEELKRRGD